MESLEKEPEDSWSDISSETERPRVSMIHGPLLESINQHVFHQPRGPKDWQMCPELPTGKEIMVSQLEADPLPHNRVNGGWPSKGDYLETHYRLLRREGTEVLRYAVNKYKSNPSASDDEDLCIYTKVRVLGYLMTRLGPLCRIEFSTEHAQRKIVWQQSRRLVPGAVVAISTKRDNFKTICMTATVAQRPYRGGLNQNPPRVDIIWGNVNDYVIDPEMELIMVEARSGYFEAVRHTLVGLQMAAESDSPIFKYVVDGDKSDAPASFIREKPYLDLTSCLSPNADPGLVEWLREYDVRAPTPDIRGQTSLDETQLHALHRMITKELCIVQGPPGTGKTFTSLEAIKILLANQSKDDPPIIVSAQTNHALDQLLTLCLDAGAQIARVGGRTENERIAEHTMFNTRQKFGPGIETAYRALHARRRQACSVLQDLAKTIFHDRLLEPGDLLRAGIITQEQYDSLVDDDMEYTANHQGYGPFSPWIMGECIETALLRNKHCDKNLSGDDEEYNREEYEYEDDFENIADDEEDKDRIHGTFIPFFYKWSGKEPNHLTSWHKRAEKELRKDDLYGIPQAMRGAVYQLLLERYIEKLKPQFTQSFVAYINCCKDVRANGWLRDVGIVRELKINIVGCTTTGLTKYRGFLGALGAKTMLIEEAAETREANITSALYPSIQQLILVGDHQQLAPFSNVRWLGQDPYYLDMSMFERLVDHVGIPYIMLDKQRRMAPEIRAIVDNFYDGLIDHPVALKRAPVPGMGDKRTWLFSHNWEDSVDFNHSRYNEEEASMVVGFFGYLVNNGVDASKITVLTFYKAQRRVILKKLKQHPSLAAESYQVHTVDSYQGEENDIVLLSLVRSPPEHAEPSIGFLDNKNRVIVAISRARRGFYMFGNIVNAAHATRESGEIWGPIWNAFITQKRFDQLRGLPLQCQPHGKITWIKNTNNWADNAGGCDKRCNFIRPCGHPCPFLCHTKPHDKIRCSEICGKTLPCGHDCEKWCKDPCNCICENFQSLKAQTETRQVAEEAQLHMDLEELLEAEAFGQAHTETASAKASEPSNVRPQTQPAPQLVAVPIARPRNIIRLDTQQMRKFTALKGRPNNKPAVVRPPIVRPPAAPMNRLVNSNHPIIRPPTQCAPNSGVADYQNFVRDVSELDQANTKAHLASLAETAGQEPNIRESYRAVRLVDGRRVEDYQLSPEKLIKANESSSNVSPVPSSPKVDSSVTPAPHLVSVSDIDHKVGVDSYTPDIESLITALAALPTDGSALPTAIVSQSAQLRGHGSLNKEQSDSTVSAPSVGTSADKLDFLKDGAVSDVTTVDVDGTLGVDKAPTLIDLTMLMEEPTKETPGGTSAEVEQQRKAIQSEPYASLDDWMEAFIIDNTGQDVRIEQQPAPMSQPAAAHDQEVEDKGKGKSEPEEMLISL